MGSDLCRLFQLLDLADGAQGAVESALRPFGLTRASFNVMWNLQKRDCTNKCLAEEAGCAPSNITRLVDRLVEHGLVERRPSEDDRRKGGTTLTPAGRARWEEAAAALLQTQASMLQRFRELVEAID